jgi:hypothetical protein
MLKLLPPSELLDKIRGYAGLPKGHVYSVVLTKARNPLSREEVESHFKGELSKR